MINRATAAQLAEMREWQTQQRARLDEQAQAYREFEFTNPYARWAAQHFGHQNADLA